MRGAVGISFVVLTIAASIVGLIAIAYLLGGAFAAGYYRVKQAYMRRILKDCADHSKESEEHCGQ